LASGERNLNQSICLQESVIAQMFSRNIWWWFYVLRMLFMESSAFIFA